MEPVAVPEALGLVVQGSSVASSGSLVELREQRLACLLAGVVGKLDGDGLGGAQRLLPVQALDGLLGLVSFVKADETHSSRDACSMGGKGTKQGNRYHLG